MELYSFTDEEVKQANASVPYYIPSTIPAGTYPGVAYDVNTVAVSGIFVTNANIDEELIYQVTKAMWSKTARKLLDNGHPKGKVITLETALDGVEGIGVPLHPGAERSLSRSWSASSNFFAPEQTGGSGMFCAAAGKPIHNL